jgi:hypothetical protein
MAKQRTYAQQAKSIMNKYKLRLGDKFDKGDPLAVAAMNAELTELQGKQEQARAAKQQAEQTEQAETIQQFQNGGKLTKKQQNVLSDILTNLPKGAVQQGGVFQNPAGDSIYSNVGRAGEANFIGEPLSAFRRPQQVMDESKRMNLQQGLVHEQPVQIPLRRQYGTGPGAEPGAGFIPQFANGGNLFQQGFNLNQGVGQGMNQFGVAPQLQMPQQMGLGAYQAAQSGGANLGAMGTMGLNMNQAGGGQTFMNNVAGGGVGNNGGLFQGGNVGGQDGFVSRVPWSSAISGVGDIIANSIKVDMPKYDYEEYKPQKAQANLVDYRREREQVGRERDLANAQISRAAKSRGSQAGLMESILAGQTGTQRTAGQQFGASLEREGNVNAQIKNQVQAQNQQIDMNAFQINSRNKQFANQLERADAIDSNVRKQNMVQAGFGSVSQYLQDRQQASQYDQMVNMEMARNPNYSLQQADPTFWRRLAGVTDPIDKINFTNTGDALVNRG